MSATQKKDLTKLEKKSTEQQESDSLQKLRSQILAKKEFEHKLMTSQQKDASGKKTNAELLEELAKKANALEETPVDDVVENDNSELLSKIEELENAVADLKVQNADLSNKLDDHSEQEALIKELNDKHDKEIKDLSKKYEKELKDLSVNSDKEVSELKKNFAAQKASLEKDLAATEKLVKEANDKKNSELDLLEAKYEKKLAEANSKLDESKVEASKVSGITAEYEEKLKNQQTHYENLMAGKDLTSENFKALVESFEQQRDLAVREAKSSSTRSVNAYKKAADKYKQDISKYKSDLSKLNNSVKNNEIKFNKELNDCKKKIAAANKEAELAKKSLKETRVSVLKNLQNKDLELLREQLEDDQRKLTIESEQVEMEASYLKLYREEIDQKYKKDIQVLKAQIKELEAVPLNLQTPEVIKEQELLAKAKELANELEKVSKNACELELKVNELNGQLSNVAPVIQAPEYPDLSEELYNMSTKANELESQNQQLLNDNSVLGNDLEKANIEIERLNVELAKFVESEKASDDAFNDKLDSLMSLMKQSKEDNGNDEELARLQEQLENEITVEKGLYDIIADKDKQIEELKKENKDYKDQIQLLQLSRFAMPYPQMPYYQQPIVQPVCQQSSCSRNDSDLRDLERRRDQELRDLEKKHDAELEELEKKRAAELEDIKSQNDAAFNDLQQQHADELAALMDKLNSLEDDLRELQEQEEAEEEAKPLDLQFPVQEPEKEELPDEDNAVINPVSTDPKYNDEFLNKLNNIIRTRKVIEARLADTDRIYEDELAKNSALQEEYEKKIEDLKIELDDLNEQHRNHKNYSEKEVKEYELNKSKVFNDLVIKEDTLNKLSYDEVGRIRTRHSYNVRLLKDELSDLDAQELALRQRYGYPKEEEKVVEPEPEEVRVIESAEERFEREAAVKDVPLVEDDAPFFDVDEEEEKPVIEPMPYARNVAAPTESISYSHPIEPTPVVNKPEDDKYNNLVTAKRLNILEEKYTNALNELEGKNDTIQKYISANNKLEDLNSQIEDETNNLNRVGVGTPEGAEIAARLRDIDSQIDECKNEISKLKERPDIKDYIVLSSKLKEVERLKEQYK